MAILNGVCACDCCGISLVKGQGALNIRNTRLYCQVCFARMKSRDARGEELPLGESWDSAVSRTSREWA